eukprot:jgi/Mesen1/3703/ME000202S02791
MTVGQYGFDGRGRVSGAAIRSYLLERSRVEAELYKLPREGNRAASFHYLNQSSCYELGGEAGGNAEEYRRTRAAMTVMGITEAEKAAIFGVLAAILHIGNIEFSLSPDNDSLQVAGPQSVFHLETAAELLQCDKGQLEESLLTRTIVTRNEVIKKPLDAPAAVSKRDTLAKTIYSKLFDCFEQFCINLANEKLQQHFNQARLQRHARWQEPKHVLKMEQEVYEREEINWSYIDFVDNKDVLDLIEAVSQNGTGIIALLDEQWGGKREVTYVADQSTLDGAVTASAATSRSGDACAFQSLGGAGPDWSPLAVLLPVAEGVARRLTVAVTYITDEFLTKNTDLVVAEHQELLARSLSPFIAALFAPLAAAPADDAAASAASKQRNKFASLGRRFKQQLAALMETLQATQPHYIRCVKPNARSTPAIFDNHLVLGQLRSGDEEAVEKLLQTAKLSNYQIGKSKVFLRAGQMAHLEALRTDVMNTAARRIQRSMRAHLFRRHRLRATLVIQSRWLQRRRYLALRAAAIVVQTRVRGWLARRNYRHMRETRLALAMQRLWRGGEVRKPYRALRRLVRRWRAIRERKRLARLKKGSGWAVPVLEAKVQDRCRSLVPRARERQCAWGTAAAAADAPCGTAHLDRARTFQGIPSGAIAGMGAVTHAASVGAALAGSAAGAVSGALRGGPPPPSIVIPSERLNIVEKIQRIREGPLASPPALPTLLLSPSMKQPPSHLGAALNPSLNPSPSSHAAIPAFGAAADASPLRAGPAAASPSRAAQFQSPPRSHASAPSPGAGGRQPAGSPPSRLALAFSPPPFPSLPGGASPGSLSSSSGGGLAGSAGGGAGGVGVPGFSKLVGDMQREAEKVQGLKKENQMLKGAYMEAALRADEAEREAHELRARVEGAEEGARARAHHQQELQAQITSLLERLAGKERLEADVRLLSQRLLAQEAAKGAKLPIDKQQEVLLKEVSADLGFGRGGQPVAATVIFKSLLHWRAFEGEKKNSTFDRLVETIQRAARDDSAHNVTYWLSNTARLYYLVHHSDRHLLALQQQQAAASSSSSFSFFGRSSSKQPPKAADVASQVDVMLFKSQLEGSVERLYITLRDQQKTDLNSHLNPTVQKDAKLLRASSSANKRHTSSYWSYVLVGLRQLYAELSLNHVEPFLVRTLLQQLLASVNAKIFNSLMLRSQWCPCTYSNAEVLAEGLAQLDKWLAEVDRALSARLGAATPSLTRQLRHLRQAAALLVLDHKPTRTLDAIRQLCPDLNMSQLAHICLYYEDDKYGSAGVSPDIVQRMFALMSESSALLILEDDSIPFTIDQLCESMEDYDIDEVEPPDALIREGSFAFLLPRAASLSPSIRASTPRTGSTRLTGGSFSGW